MPFMLGPSPVRRTFNYLKAGHLVFRDRVKIMEMHYNIYFRRFALTHLENFQKIHQGMHDFHYWDIPQIQYANPKVQIVRFLDKMPNPFIRCWFDDGTSVIFDCFNKDRESILKQLVKTVGKTKEWIEAEKKLAESSAENYDNPAVFGYNQPNFCICEVPGQVPCSGVCPLPKKMVGLYTKYKTEILESWENNLDAEYPDQQQLAKDYWWYPLPNKPPVTGIKGIEKPFLREFGKTSTHDIAPPDSYYEWHEQKKPLVDEESET